MRVRWRLAVFVIQLLMLAIATYVVTDRPYSGDTWFVAGIFAIVINPQLLEPYYPRPADVVGNSAISLLLILTAQKGIATPGWNFLAILLTSVFILSIAALALGAGRKEGSIKPLARAASVISREATSTRIYSAIFWLAIIDTFTLSSRDLWILGGTWALLVLIGSVNWQRIWGIATGDPSETRIEGIIGPSTMLISSSEIPNPGDWVSIKSGSDSVDGVIASRIRRINDVWGKVHIPSQSDCELIVRKSEVSIKRIETEKIFLGQVSAGSNESSIIFSPTEDLEIGEIVSVQGGESEILFQINSAFIQSESVKDGSQLYVSAKAAQVGQFDEKALVITRHDWVPRPGAPVGRPSVSESIDLSGAPVSWLHLGDLVGCKIPVFIDLNRFVEGHLAILGMTKMGKTSLAHRIVHRLSNGVCVTILDQTGEYRTKRSIPPQEKDRDMCSPGIAVYEPEPGKIAPDVALACLDRVFNLARSEYDSSIPFPRTFLIDEAHQFIPEPAILGYGGAGRDSSLKIGSLMMQIRKFGISMLLISQRTAVIAKSAISQCENLIVFRSVDQTGLNYLESIIGAEACKLLPRLKQGQALCFGPAFSSDAPVVIQIKMEDLNTKETMN